VQLLGVGSTLPVRLSQVRMPGIHRHSQAYREAYKRLVKLTTGKLAAGVELFDIGLQHEPGDVVEITHPVGFTTEPFRVLGVQMPGPGRWRLALRQHVSAAYIDDVTTAPAQPVLPVRIGDDLRTVVVQDTHDFGGAGFGTIDARTVVYTPPVACEIEFTARLVAANVLGDSGNTVSWRVTPAGGSTVILGGSETNSTARQEFVAANKIVAAAGVALTFAIRTTRSGGNPDVLLYGSYMRITAKKT